MHRSNTIVVVGARVAGAATALHLARRGHRVVILDRSGPPADTTSTHLMMRAGVFHLNRLGLTDQLVAAGTPLVRDLRLGFGQRLIEVSVSPAHGVVAFMAPRRTVLDKLLLDTAIESGAEFYPGVTVDGVIRDMRGRVMGVQGSDGRTPFGIPAAWVVGADGRRSNVADLVEAAITESHVSAGGIIYSYFEVDTAPIFDIRYQPGWGFGMASSSGGTAMIYAGFDDSNGRGSTDDVFWTAVNATAPELTDQLRDSPRMERYRRITKIPSFLRRAHGPGWVLVGDAGSTSDPQTAHGLTSAFRDAELAADAIHLAMSGASDDGFERYRSVRDRFARPLLDNGCAMSGYAVDAEEASARMRALGAVNDATCDYFADAAAVAA